MYRIRLDKVEELKAGRTIVYLEGITGYTRQYLSEAFTGKRNLPEKSITKILIPICNESVKLKERLDKEGIEKIIDYFFQTI